MSQDATTRLTSEEIHDIIHENDEHVVDEIFSLCSGLISAEDERFSIIERKAAIFFGMFGAVATLSITLAGVVLTGDLKPVGEWSLRLAWVFYGFTLIFGTDCVFFAWSALAVGTSYAIFSEKALFRKFESVDGFKRWALQHIWMIYRQNHASNDVKAKKIIRAQRSFLIFTFCVFAFVLNVVLPHIWGK